MRAFYCTGPVATHTMSAQAVVVTKQRGHTQKKMSSKQKHLHFWKPVFAMWWETSGFSVFQTAESKVRSLLLKVPEGNRSNSLSHEYRKWALTSFFLIPRQQAVHYVCNLPHIEASAAFDQHCFHCVFVWHKPQTPATPHFECRPHTIRVSFRNYGLFQKEHLARCEV